MSSGGQRILPLRRITDRVLRSPGSRNREQQEFVVDTAAGQAKTAIDYFSQPGDMNGLHEWGNQTLGLCKSDLKIYI